MSEGGPRLQDRPERVPLAVGVGVTGHQELLAHRKADIEWAVESVLERLKDEVQALRKDPGFGYTNDEPVMRIVSSLADGADVLVARLAIQKGYSLIAPLPFDRNWPGYKRGSDFDDRNRALESESAAVIEIHGSWDPAAEPGKVRTDEALAYKAARKILLAHSDILIAVWDGEMYALHRRTARIVRAAVEQQIPVIWIDSRSPGEVRVQLYKSVHGRGSPEDFDKIGVVLERVLGILPRSNRETKEGTESLADLKHFLAEEHPATLGGRVGLRRWCEDLYTWGWSRFWASTKRKTNAKSSGTPEASPRAKSRSAFALTYDLVDQLAIRYARLYRSSFFSNYISGAAAVTLALLAYVFHWFEALFVGGELAVILLMILNLKLSGRGRWQERSVDYRFLAEQLRQMEFLEPLGMVTPFPRRQPHHAPDPGASWMNGYFRAFIRSRKVTGRALTATHVDVCRKRIRDGLVAGQRYYHESTEARYRLMEERLHAWATRLFWATGVCCVAHLVLAIPQIHGAIAHGSPVLAHLVGSSLTLAAAAFPAAGAAAHAISGQAEARRLAERSRAMRDLMTGLAEHLGGSHPVTSTALIEDSERVAEAMLQEVIDWRVIYRVQVTVP